MSYCPTRSDNYRIIKLFWVSYVFRRGGGQMVGWEHPRWKSPCAYIFWEWQINLNILFSFLRCVENSYCQYYSKHISNYNYGCWFVFKMATYVEKATDIIFFVSDETENLADIGGVQLNDKVVFLWTQLLQHCNHNRLSHCRLKSL